MLRQLILSSCFQILLQGLEEPKHNLSQERNIESYQEKKLDKVSNKSFAKCQERQRVGRRSLPTPAVTRG
jgi:hypothetical protein